MALFQKNPYDSTDHKALYTLGQQKTLLIVGLGNPGKKYDGTRHNIGFACIDAFAAAQGFSPWTDKKDFKCQVTMHMLGDIRVILAKPTTFMNLSGRAVLAVANFYKLTPAQTAVVHDELDIPFGQIRVRTGGSSAGHNGIQSIIDDYGAELGRVRVGIDNETQPDTSGDNFVLSKFNKNERPQLKFLKREVISILTEFVYRGEVSPETRSFLV